MKRRQIIRRRGKKEAKVQGLTIWKASKMIIQEKNDHHSVHINYLHQIPSHCPYYSKQRLHSIHMEVIKCSVTVKRKSEWWSQKVRLHACRRVLQWPVLRSQTEQEPAFFHSSQRPCCWQCPHAPQPSSQSRLLWHLEGEWTSGSSLLGSSNTDSFSQHYDWNDSGLNLCTHVCQDLGLCLHALKSWPPIASQTAWHPIISKFKNVLVTGSTCKIFCRRNTNKFCKLC